MRFIAISSLFMQNWGPKKFGKHSISHVSLPPSVWMGWKEWKYIEPTIHFWTAWLCTLYHLPHYTTSDDLRLICAFSPDITKNVCNWPQLNLFSSKQTVFYPFITCALTLHLYIHLQGSAHVSCHRSVVEVCVKQISRQHFFFLPPVCWKNACRTIH